MKGPSAGVFFSMYGMVNNAFRRYVIDHQGEAAWNDIVARAELETAEFGSMMAYDDSVTLSIIGAMVSESGRDPDDILKDVGRSWVRFAKTTSFAGLLAMAGQNFESLIGSLDDMHARIKTSLPALRPPSFDCQRLDGGLIEVTYHSEREGLFPFVLGVFEGLADDFEEQVDVVEFEQLSSSSAKWTLKMVTTATHAA